MQLRALLATALLALSSACSASTTPRDDGGTDSSLTDRALSEATPGDGACSARTPRVHRASGSACPADRPASNCAVTGGPPVSCTADTECTSGTNGRCVGNAHDGCRCSYDTCQRDSDCTSGGPCGCRLSGRGSAGANVCLGGNCATDSQCGPCGFCSPTLGDCGDYTGTIGYYCHTPQDECVDDEDCSALDAGFLGQRPYCRYQPTVGRWTCSNQQCAG